MQYLKLPHQKPVAVNKAFFTVGSGTGCDLAFGGKEDRILFSIHQEKDESFLIPGQERLRLNGKLVGRPTQLSSCDRIEWQEQTAVFIDEDLGESKDPKQAFAQRSLEILQNLAANLESKQSHQIALHQALTALVDLAGAEVGYLVTESSEGHSWELLACVGENGSDFSHERKQRELISSTVLNEAIQQRKPIYVESIVGHPWGEQASIMNAQVFSFACLPLMVGDRIFGCVYLVTQTPGKSIAADVLDELNVLATQSALLLASQADLRRVRRENQRLKKGGKLGHHFVFDRESSANPMHQVAKRVEKLARTDLNLLIQGETGTGKELVAREIHQNSERANKPFVAINCGAIPPTLIESTLFGYVKGAFTGANKDQKGKFEQAQGGTVFLDEIGDLPLELQVKLLRVLQEKQVEPVGAGKTVHVDFRVLAATHKNLEAAVQEGAFREDLFFRINGATISLPPLRERGRDVIVLAEYFLDQIGQGLKLAPSAVDLLLKHRWSGNVRELDLVIRRAAALAEGSVIEAEDLELSSHLPAAQLPHQALPDYDDYKSLREAQLRFTQELVRKTLERFEGNRSKAASHLGVSERTLYRILASDEASISN